MSHAAPQLVRFDRAAFLRDYWQQKPLLIRNPWDQWTNPLEPDELAGLACEDGVESRLITLDAERIGPKMAPKMELEQGPLAAARFERLGRSPYTLLVQAVDQHVPQVAALLEPFRFIPDWRIDDVMVSYAADGGGVGAHFDQYDVFLLQGLGQRRWQIGGLCDDLTPLQDHDDLRLLADFQPLEEWVLNPGDILYVPPRYAHNGVAVGDDCMTYSIGFRAPSRGELLGDWMEEVLGELRDDDRYVDPGLPAQDNPGEVTPAALDRLQKMIAEKLLDREGFAHWFGQFTSAPKTADIDWRPEDEVSEDHVREMLGEQAALLRNPACRFVFIREPDGVELSLFVDGERVECSGEAARFAEQLCAHKRLLVSAELAQSAAVTDLIGQLLNQGVVAFEVEE